MEDLRKYLRAYREQVVRISLQNESTEYCVKNDIESLGLVNQGKACIVRVEAVDKINLPLCIARIFPNTLYFHRLYWRATCRVKRKTMSVCTTQADSNIVSVSCAGLTLEGSTYYVIFLFNYILAVVSLAIWGHPGGLSVSQFAFKLVNGVFILSLGNRVLNVVDYISSNVDRLLNFNPVKFPGATFEPSTGECTKCLAFSTGRITFLGCQCLKKMRQNLVGRIRMYLRFCTPGGISRGPDRQNQRVLQYLQWKSRS